MTVSYNCYGLIGGQRQASLSNGKSPQKIIYFLEINCFVFVLKINMIISTLIFSLEIQSVVKDTEQTISINCPPLVNCIVKKHPAIQSLCRFLF